MADAWTPSRIVTWTTDFGLSDTYVGAMKGAALQVERSLALIDLSHDVPPQDVLAAAFLLRHAWQGFPDGTVHVAVVDPGVGTERRALVARQGTSAFVAPDNGLLPGVLGQGAVYFELEEARFGPKIKAATFHGRDLFAPVAAAIAGGLAPDDAGSVCLDPVRLPQDPRSFEEEADHGADEVAASIIWVDRFGNLVTTFALPRAGWDPAGWRARVLGRELGCALTYADAAPGEPVVLMSSFGSRYGHLEIAVRGGNAARTLGLEHGAQSTLR